MDFEKPYDCIEVGKTEVNWLQSTLTTDIRTRGNSVTVYWKFPFVIPKTDLDLNIFSAMYANVAALMAKRVQCNFRIDPTLLEAINVLKYHEENMVRYCFQRPKYHTQFPGDRTMTPSYKTDHLTHLEFAYSDFRKQDASATLCMSCGKDSYLSYELLRQGGIGVSGLVGVEFCGRGYLRDEYARWAPPEPTYLIDTNVVDFFQWAPDIYDPGFMSINYCLIACALVAKAIGTTHVVIANEYDRTELPKPCIEKDGADPCEFLGAHYDQTNHFLNVMQQHILRRIGVNVVNLLGNLSELGVQYILTRISDLWRFQMSCNVTPDKNCKICGKCRRVGLMLKAIGVEPHLAQFEYYVEALNMTQRELFGESDDPTDLRALRYLLLGDRLGDGANAFKLRADAYHPMILPTGVQGILQRELKKWRDTLGLMV